MMICKECGAIMSFVDKDFNFDDNYDIYWRCSNDNCMTTCVSQVRLGQSINEFWHTDYDDKVIDCSIHHIIKVL